MVDKLKRMIFRDLYADLEHQARKQNTRTLELDERERMIEEEIGRRVASTLAQMDPWEPVMREFGGIFTDEYERPEDKLDEQGKFLMESFGYQMVHDPSFNWLIEWIVNTQGQAAVKKGDPTDKTILFSRAMIAAPLVIRKEVRRLANLYEDRVAGHDNFDETLSTE